MELITKSINFDLLKISFEIPRFKLDVKRLKLDALTINRDAYCTKQVRKAAYQHNRQLFFINPGLQKLV